MKKETGYEYFIDAINYRRSVIGEHLNNKFLPASIRTEYEAKLEFLEKIDWAMF